MPCPRKHRRGGAVYNLKTDPGETTNLYLEETERAQTLKTKLEIQTHWPQCATELAVALVGGMTELKNPAAPKVRRATQPVCPPMFLHRRAYFFKRNSV